MLPGQVDDCEWRCVIWKEKKDIVIIFAPADSQRFDLVKWVA